MLTKPVLLTLFFVGIVLSVLGSGVDTSLNFTVGINSTDNKVLATVNQQAITQAELAHAKSKNPKVSIDNLLNLMIDNYLLLQRAQELGLLQSDRVVRKAIVHQVVEQTVNNALNEQKKLSEQSLLLNYQSFYHENIMMFTTADQYQLQIANFSDKAQQCKLNQQVKLQWNGIQLNTKEWQQHLISQPLAKGLHSEILVYRQLGHRLAKQVVNMKKGEFSAPISIEQGCMLIYLSDRKAGEVLSFEQAKKQVISQYRTMLRRNALTDLLLTLREKADIEVAQDIIEVLTHE